MGIVDGPYVIFVGWDEVERSEGGVQWYTVVYTYDISPNCLRRLRECMWQAFRPTRRARVCVCVNRGMVGHSEYWWWIGPISRKDGIRGCWVWGMWWMLGVECEVQWIGGRGQGWKERSWYSNGTIGRMCMWKNIDVCVGGQKNNDLRSQRDSIIHWVQQIPSETEKTSHANGN